MMDKKELTCIVCPIGCRLSAELNENGSVTAVTGNTCPRGKAYAIAELTHPTRTLTTTVRIANRQGRMLAVKSRAPISKERLMEAMDILSKTEAEAPVCIGDVILENLFGEADIIAPECVD